MSDTAEKTLDTHALTLVRAHYDDEMSFDQAVRDLAAYYNGIDRISLAEYCMAFLPGVPTLSTMEVDPLPNIARDMYATIEAKFGADSEEAKDYRIRLASYFPEFAARCVKEGSIRTYGWQPE